MSVIRKGSRPKMCVPSEPSAISAISMETVELAPAPANVVANVEAPVRRKRPTKVAPKDSSVTEVPSATEGPSATEAPRATKEPNATKAPKAPKATKAKTTKATKATKAAEETPLLHKEVTLPTHQEMDMEEYSAEGFHIQHVSISVFTHNGTTYFRDKRKNKLYQYGGPRRVGTYVGRYHPGREEIFTDLPDSDAEES